MSELLLDCYWDIRFGHCKGCINGEGECFTIYISIFVGIFHGEPVDFPSIVFEVSYFIFLFNVGGQFFHVILLVGLGSCYIIMRIVDLSRGKRQRVRGLSLS